MHIAERAQSAAHAVKSQALVLEQKAQHIASSLIEGDKSKKHRGGSGVVWHWPEHRRAAHGCVEDYIGIGEGRGIRHWHTGNHVIERSPDPVFMLMEGIPVLFYNPNDRLFERRVLKVDNTLSFLYVLIDPAGMKGGLHAGEGGPVTLRLNKILNVWAGTEAMRIADDLAVEDPHLSIDSSVVVQFGDKEQQTPSLDKVFLFMTAPQQHLQMSIQACVQAERRANSSVVETAAKPALESARDPLQKAGASTAKKNHEQQLDTRRVNGVVLRELSPIFDRSAEGMDLQVLLRPDNTPVSLKLVADIDLEDSDSIVRRAALDANHHFAPIDCARISFVHRDVASLREWATVRLPGVFGGKLWTYVQDPRTLQAVVPQDEGFREAAEQTKRTLACSPRIDAGRFWEQSVRSSWKALQHMMQLEADFAMIIERGKALGVPACEAAASRTMTLSDDVLRGALEADNLPTAQVAEGGAACSDVAPMQATASTDQGDRPPAPLGILGDALAQEHSAIQFSDTLPSPSMLPTVNSPPTPMLPGDPGRQVQMEQATPSEIGTADSVRGTWASFEQRNENHSARSICGSEALQAFGPETPCGMRRRDGHDEPCVSACVGIRDPKCVVQ